MDVSRRRFLIGSFLLMFLSQLPETGCKPIVHRIRRRCLPYVHWKKDRVGEAVDRNLYAQYTLSPREEVGLFEMGPCEARELLSDLGFQYEPVAALKFWETEDGTTFVESGSYVKRDSPFSRMQVHVHVFEFAEEEVLLAAHREYNWIRHPIRHYWPDKYGHYSPSEGVAAVEDLLEDHHERPVATPSAQNPARTRAR